MRQFISASLLVILQLFYPLQSSAQKAPTKSKLGLVSHYLTHPLSLDEVTLGLGFQGHDIASILSELKQFSNPNKSEFETTLQYQQRISTFLESKSRQFVFVLEDEEAIKVKYDAEKGVTTLSLTMKEEDASFGGDFQPYLVATKSIKETSRTSYTDKNAIGVKFQVMKIIADQPGLAFRKTELLSDDAHQKKDWLTFEIDALAAKALNPYLRVAFVCTLLTPMIFEHLYTKHVPTISQPWLLEIRKQYMLIHPDELWLYDVRSGWVVMKFIPRPLIFFESGFWKSSKDLPLKWIQKP